jgi:predicted  nucleic acid-binding Zn-ribbon protein
MYPNLLRFASTILVRLLILQVADYKNYKKLKEEVETIQERRAQVSRQMADIVRQKVRL